MTASSDAEFSALYQDHYSTVLRMMLRWLPELDAEDAAQETFLRAWRHWPPRHDETRRWLLAIARSVLVDAIRWRAVNRKRSALVEIDMPTDKDGFFQADSPEDAILAAVVQAEQWQAVERVWPSLTERQQAALLMWMGGASSPDAAPHFGVTPTGYRRLVQRGQQKLQRAVMP